MTARAGDSERATQPAEGDSRELSAQVLRRLPARDPQALTAFYEAYFDRVYAYVRRMVGEEHLAEDLTQDIFMHLHQTLPSYDPERALAPWVFTIATNKVRDHWRSRRHRMAAREVALAEDERGGVTLTDDAGPSRRMEDRELAVRLGRAIAELPESMRVTLVLRYFEELSFEDIGRILDRKEDAVRKRYSRALEELRRALEEPLRRDRGDGA